MIFTDPSSNLTVDLLREQKRVEQTQRFSAVLGGVSAVQFILSVWFADYKLVALFGVAMVMAVIVARYYPRLSSGVPYILTYLNILAYMVIVQIVMPANPAGIVLIIAFGLICFA